MRDIAKLFPEEKRLGTKASDLVSGTALTVCLDIDEAFEVLGTSPEQRVAILASTVFCADTSHGIQNGDWQKLPLLNPKTPKRNSISIGLGPTPKLRASPNELMPQHTLTAKTILRSISGKRQKP